MLRVHVLQGRCFAQVSGQEHVLVHVLVCDQAYDLAHVHRSPDHKLLSVHQQELGLLQFDRLK
jgi:hypothetical protein